VLYASYKLVLKLFVNDPCNTCVLQVIMLHGPSNLPKETTPTLCTTGYVVTQKRPFVTACMWLSLVPPCPRHGPQLSTRPRMHGPLVSGYTIRTGDMWDSHAPDPSSPCP